MTEAVLPGRPRATSELSGAEIVEALGSLSDGEKTALAKIARLYAWKTPYDHQDLLQEAICRVLDGKRTWRKDLPAVPFLGGVMRSIASEWKHDPLERDADIGDQGAAARAVMSKMEMTQLLALFEDDPVSQKLLLGMMEGARGEELQRSCGLEQTDYESRRRKIRRRIEKLGM